MAHQRHNHIKNAKLINVLFSNINYQVFCLSNMLSFLFLLILIYLTHIVNQVSHIFPDC
jgi:hypothetical protein